MNEYMKTSRKLFYLSIHFEPPLCMDTAVPEPRQPGVTFGALAGNGKIYLDWHQAERTDGKCTSIVSGLTQLQRKVKK